MRQDDDLVFESLDKRFRVVITSGAMNRIWRECLAVGNKEAGGILAGRYSADKTTAVVTHISIPTPDTRSGKTWLHRGIKGLSSWLTLLWNWELAYYLGEWHFHPYASPTPSSIDLKQLSKIATAVTYQCTEPVMLIFGGDPQGVWSISVTLNDNGTIQCLREIS